MPPSCFDWQVDGGGAFPVARGPRRRRRRPQEEEEAVQPRLATQQHAGQGPLTLLRGTGDERGCSLFPAIFLCCALFLISCSPQESNPLLSMLKYFAAGLRLSLYLVCEQMRALFLRRFDAFVAAATGSVTGSLCLFHLSLSRQIKAQGCRKSGLHGVLGSKLAGDVTQLKQKAQGKKNLSGTGSRDKEVSPCSSNPKHRHRSQGAGRGESRPESGGQSDTGRRRVPPRPAWFSFNPCGLLNQQTFFFFYPRSFWFEL